MGYYTDFSLNVSIFQNSADASADPQNISPLVKHLLEDEVDEMDVFEGGNCDDGWYGNAKWYEWDADMLLLSKKFPDLLFELDGVGESFGDIWSAYFHDGAHQMCRASIEYPPFSPSEMVQETVDTGGKYSYQS